MAGDAARQACGELVTVVGLMQGGRGLERGGGSLCLRGWGRRPEVSKVGQMFSSCLNPKP